MRSTSIWTRTLVRLHVALYLLTSGRVGGHVEDKPVLILGTMGRRSGRRRRTPLVYRRDSERLVVCGGSAGTPHDPGWIFNLRADPRVRVRVGSRECAAEAYEAEGPERARLWREFASEVPRVVHYQSLMERRVPVVVLAPVTSELIQGESTV